MNWRAYALRFAMVDGSRWWLRSRRPLPGWAPAVVVLGIPPVVGIGFGIEAIWLLTGRARRVRHALGNDEIQVIPGRRKMPERRRREWAELVERNREEFERMKADLERASAERDA